jgi:phytanoyl-CoA hydroxylase
MAYEHGGIGALDRPTDSKYQDPLIAAHSSPQYLAFLSHSALRGFIRKFTGWKKDIILERTMLRHSVPGASSTAIHYDQIYLRAGNPDHEFLTAWVPLGDIAVDGGGLMYLEGSSDLGRQFEQKFTEGAKNMTREERENAFNANMMTGGALSQDAEGFRVAHGGDRRWLVANYQAGDVVFHNPYMVSFKLFYI